MIFHQLLLGAGSYLYLRDLKASRAASLYAAAVLALCAYGFALIRNMTLPASIAWLPIALYFERNIKTGESERPFIYMMGLAFSVAMIVHVGRPEVGVPELLLLLIACMTRPVMALASRGKEEAALKATFYKLSSLGLGLALGLPTIAPGLEWTSLSPRSQGLALRWVLLWSANWYDYLSLVLSQPLGDLCYLDEHTAQFRRMVLSRGGYIPFLSSSYLSPIAVTMAIWGISDRQDKMRMLTLALLAGFVLMSLGGYTPFAPAIIGLSPLFSAFRYPVKLMIFPSLLLILLAVRGLDLLIKRKLSLRILAGTSLFWLVVAIAAILLLAFPQIGIIAGEWRWLFQAKVVTSVLNDAQLLMAGSMLYAAALALAACLCSYLCLKSKLKPVNAATLIIVLSCATLIHSALSSRRITPSGFYEHPSSVAVKLQELRKEQRLATSGKIDLDIGAGASRVLNLYFDPLTVPPGYKSPKSSCFDEDFFQYSRELALYNTVLCFRLPSSFGYEAAETAEYKTCFTQAFQACSQCHRDNKKEIVTDVPIHRFAGLTASQFINTQVYNKADGELPKLNDKCFELLYENRGLNYRIYRAKNVRPRIYFSGNLVFQESFKDFQKLVCAREDLTETRIFDNSADITYLLNKDFEKYKEQFTQINRAAKAVQNESGTVKNSEEKIELLADNGQEMKLSLSATKPRLLVIADNVYPGWVAELDGKKVEILKVNLFNRAVLIPEGTHTLRMNYWCQPLALSTAVALASLLIFLLGYWLVSRKTLKNSSDG